MTKNAFEELNASQEASGKSKFSNQGTQLQVWRQLDPSITAARSLNFSRTVGEVSL